MSLNLGLTSPLQAHFSIGKDFECALFAFGRVMVMLTSLLALFHHPGWTWFTLFIGFNCLQSSFTGFCPPRVIFRKLGLKSEREIALSKV